MVPPRVRGVTADGEEFAMKIFIRVLIALAILIALSVAGMFIYIDSIARVAVERGASGALGVKTTLKSADVGVFGGTFAMSGLRVENPPGFTDNPFLTLEDGDAAVSLGTLRKDTIELPHLRLTGIGMAIDRREGNSNYGVILEHVKGDRAPSSEPTSKEGKNYIIREVTIRDVSVRASFAPLGGEPMVVTIPIKEIALKDVGSEKPLSLSEIAGVIVQAVMSAVVENGGGLLPDDLLKDLDGALSRLGSLSELGVDVTTELGEQAKQLLDNVGSVGEEAGKAAGEVGKTLEGIGKNLFPGKKKEEGGGG